jgi:hypothetical protein
METTFQLIAPADVEIAGVPSSGMTIRAAGRTLGQLNGFVVDNAQQNIRYLVVRASGLFGRARLVPFAQPRVDVADRAIDVDVDERELRQLRHFTPEHLLGA